MATRVTMVGFVFVAVVLQVMFPFSGVLVEGTPLRSGITMQNRRVLQDDPTELNTTSVSSTSDSSINELVGKMVLTVTLQADFAPLQDEIYYRNFKSALQKSISMVAYVPVADVEVVSLTPGSVVCLSVISFYQSSDEEKARTLMSGFKAAPSTAVTQEFQELYGKVSASSSRWIKAKVPGAAPGLTDSQMMGIWIAVAIAILLAITAIVLILRLRFGWCNANELQNYATYDPQDMPVPLSIKSRRITSQDADAAGKAPMPQAPLQRKPSVGKPPLPWRGPSGNFANRLQSSKSIAAAEAAEAGEGGLRRSLSAGVAAIAAGAAAAAAAAAIAAVAAVDQAGSDDDFKLKSAPSQQEDLKLA